LFIFVDRADICSFNGSILKSVTCDLCQRKASLWHSVRLPQFQRGECETCTWRDDRNSPGMGWSKYCWSATENGWILCVLGSAASSRHRLGIELMRSLLSCCHDNENLGILAQNWL